MKAGDVGRVITRYGAELVLENDQGEHIRCTTRRKLEHVACGDYVRWQREAQGNASVIEILPRKNALSRPDIRGKLRTVAANIDVLLIVNSWRPAPNWELLDRYLITAHSLSADPLIIFNKSDLRSQYADTEHLACLEEYQRLGYVVLHTQASGVDYQDIAAICRYVAGRTAILVGQSGVGKSSLLHKLLPKKGIRVGAIADTGEGRHTTTVANLYHLPACGTLIDSPGVRDFALGSLTVPELQAGHPEFEPFMGLCRFNNCTHHHEPGCAVKAAVLSAKVPQRRYERYLGLLKSQINN